MLIDNLMWRYATKKFDSTKKLNAEQLDYLKRSVQLAVSSYGLQMYNILIVQNQEIKEKLRPVSWNQPQITDCSHLFIFCNYAEYRDKYVDEYIDRSISEQELDTSLLENYREFIKTKIKEKSSTELDAWMQKQIYMAVSNLIIACAEQNIDACPMEGFEPKLVNEELQLGERKLNALVMVAIGFRDKEDSSQFRKKIRKPIEQLFINFS